MAGNITDDDTYAYTWDAAGRLEEIELSGTSTNVGSYTYNHASLRGTKVVSSTTTHYVYGIDGLLYGEYDSSGDLIREYVYLNGAPLAQIDDGSPEILTYLHVDHLGTPRFGTNTSGTQVWSWSGDAFGVGSTSGTATVNLRMPGQYFDDESDLFYNWNRYHNPEIGRYISSDPIGLEGGPNTFLYAMASPIMYTDVEGLMAGCGWPTEMGNINVVCHNGISLSGGGVLGSRRSSSGRSGNKSDGGGVTTPPSGGQCPPKPNPSPDFVVSPGGTVYPIPKGAKGPTPVYNEAGKQTGVAFTGGTGGANKQASTIRIMNPTPPKGQTPWYPRGYIKYENSASPTPQGVDPYSGRTLSNTKSHFPLD